jgi:hypothetical protein
LVPVITTWRFLSVRMEERPPIWEVAENSLNKHSRKANKEQSSSLVVGRSANNSPPWKLSLLQKRIHLPRIRKGPLVRPKQQKTDTRYGTWNVRILYRSGSITAVTRELTRYKLDLVRIQKGRWDKGGTVRTADYIFSMEKKLKSSNQSRMFVYHRIVSAFKITEFCICSTESATRCTWIYMYTLFLYIFALHVSGAIYTNRQEHKLQRTDIGMCNVYGMLIHWSRYWLGHPGCPSHGWVQIAPETCRAKLDFQSNIYISKMYGTMIIK